MERRNGSYPNSKSIYSTGGSCNSLTNTVHSNHSSITANVAGGNVLELSHEANVAYHAAVGALHELICFFTAAAGGVAAPSTTSVNSGEHGISVAKESFSVSAVSSLISAKKDVRDLALTAQLAFEAFVGAVAIDKIRNKVCDTCAAISQSPGILKCLPSTLRRDLVTGPKTLSSLSAIINNSATSGISKCIPSLLDRSTSTTAGTPVKPKTIVFPWRKKITDDLCCKEQPNAGCLSAPSTHNGSPVHKKLIAFLPNVNHKSEPNEDISNDVGSGEMPLTGVGTSLTVPEPNSSRSTCTQQFPPKKQRSELHQRFSTREKASNAIQPLYNNLSLMPPSTPEGNDIPTLVSRSLALTFDALARLVGADEGAILMAVLSDKEPYSVAGEINAQQHIDSSVNSHNKGLCTTFSSISSTVVNSQAICLFGTQRSPASVCVPLDHGVVRSVLKTGVALNIAPEKPTPEYSNLLCFPIYSVEARAEPIGVVLLERKYPTKISISNSKASSSFLETPSSREGTPKKCSLSKVVPPLPFTRHDETLVQGFTSLAAELLTGYGVRQQDFQFDIYDYFKKDKSSVLGSCHVSSDSPPVVSCNSSATPSSAVLSATDHSHPSLVKNSAYYHQLILRPYKPLQVVDNNRGQQRTYSAEVGGVEVNQHLTAKTGDASMTTMNHRVCKEMEQITSLLFEAIHRDNPTSHSKQLSSNNIILNNHQSTVISEEGDYIASTVARTAGTSDGTIEKLSFLVSKQPRVQLVLHSTHHSHFTRQNTKPLESTVTIAAQNVVDVTEYITSLEGCWKRSCDEVQEIMSHQQSKSEDVRECRRQIRDLKDRVNQLEKEAAQFKGRYERLRKELEMACETPLATE